MKALEVPAHGRTMRFARDAAQASPGGEPAPAGAAPAPAAAAPARVTLLDGFSVTSRGEPVTLPPSAQRLVAFLALHRSFLARTYVAGKLWVDGTPQQSSASLRSALWRTRTSDCALIEATSDRMRLAGGVAVDVREVVATARRLSEGTPAWHPEDFDPTRLSGELLPDWYDDWVLLEREQLRHLCLHALETLARRLAGLGRFAQAVYAGLMATQLEPLRESAHRALIDVHLAEGNYSEAIRQHEKYRRLLWEELGLEPSPEFRALLHAGLRAG